MERLRAEIPAAAFMNVRFELCGAVCRCVAAQHTRASAAGNRQPVAFRQLAEKIQHIMC